MSTQPDLRENDIFAALPGPDLARIERDLQAIPLPLGRPVYEADMQMRYLYFPTAGIVSLLHVMADGVSGEIAVVGSEGVVGIGLFMGSTPTPNRAIVQTAGHAYRLPAEALDREFKRDGPLQDGLLHFAQALITQMAQTAVCNRHHTVEQQLCRWLLLSLDRLP